MDVFASWNFRVSTVSSPLIMPTCSYGFSFLPCNPFYPNQHSCLPIKFNIVQAKKKNSQSEPVLKPTIVDDVELDEEEDEFIEEELEDEAFVDGDDFVEDEYEVDDPEPYAGDGGGGGGIVLAGTWWDKEALAIAEDVSLSFEGDLKIYAFKTSGNFTIRVRIEKLSNKSGSPSMIDIEAFTEAYRLRLDEAEHSGSIPENISLEELNRFKDRPMYVKYVSGVNATASSTENDGIFKLISFDLETKCCIWGLADVKVNREKAGKGRPLSKKQQEWRLNTPFDSLCLVRLYSDV